MRNSPYRNVSEAEVLPPDHYRVPALRNPFPSQSELNGGVFDSAESFFGADSECRWYEFPWRQEEESTSLDRVCLLKRFDRAMSYHDVLGWHPSVYGPAILRNAYAFAVAYPNLLRGRKIIILGSYVPGPLWWFPLLCGDATSCRLEAMCPTSRFGKDFSFLCVVREDAQIFIKSRST